jgi:hypothetical protein
MRSLAAALILWGSLGCQTAAVGPTLLLAYPGHAAGPGASPTAIRVATSPDGLTWTDAELPDSPDPGSIRGVGAAVQPSSGAERIVAWVAGGSDTVFRHGLGTSWESSTGFHHNHVTGAASEPDSAVWDSAPSLAFVKEASWLLLQRTEGSAQAFLYNQSSATSAPLPGIVPAGVPVRQRPVIARDETRFAIALATSGTRSTPSLQMVTGSVTANGLEPAPALLTPIRQGTAALPDPLVTRPDDARQRYFVASDACLAPDGHGRFLLGFVESAASVDTAQNQLLVPAAGEQRVKLFVIEAAGLPDAAHPSPRNQIEWTPWATIPLGGEQGGHPLYLQCAFNPMTSRQAIVFVTGGDSGGARGFALVPPQAGRPVYHALPAAAVASAFSLVPSPGPFSLVPVGATAAF